MSLKLSFKLSATDRMHFTDTWISNGHWAVKRSFALGPNGPKSFKAVANIANGSYYEGYKNPKADSKAPNIEEIIPKKDSYVKATIGTRAKLDSGRLVVIGVQIEGEETVGLPTQEAWVAPEYVPLLALGQVFIKDKTSPVRVEDNDGECIAIIMPVRI